ncbi:SpoIIE family protein phosphatase [Streptomyces sp. WMMC500]|uniref:PP2C family protein-serine/threonine phosphatase n=1 Tax=Streptomyces sp. WMMC500 TaxID=3015154 RepID=UPI00248B1D8A|nr:response regulator [Streptomyces sp. WMMC500]WBB58381.1 SpoIIE family protein phosphatase [Streptomyces sp. WMMC500]
MTDAQAAPRRRHPQPSAVYAPSPLPHAPLPAQRSGHGAVPGQPHARERVVPEPLTLLLIEAEPGSGPGVARMLEQAGAGRHGERIRVRTARNLTEAERLLGPDVHCILLDLSVTDEPVPADDAGPVGGGDELEALYEVLAMAPMHAVLTLTDEDDVELAAEAVRVGAQDYLFRGELDGRVLGRAIRYAVERKRADLAQSRLTASRLRAQENARLERGLLPTPLLAGSGLGFAACYRPGLPPPAAGATPTRALLGGDFYDAVRTPDGAVHAMIGDVCGHGPDEAALGVELRIAWRALTFAGLVGDELLATLQQVLENERADDEIFATMCTVDISPDARRAGLYLAGHPAPLVVVPGGRPRLMPQELGGPALGLLPRARWPRQQVELGGAWSLMLYTDGLIEGRTGPGRARLGQDGMLALLGRLLDQGLGGDDLLHGAVTEARALNGGDLNDDVAVLLLDRPPGPCGPGDRRS